MCLCSSWLAHQASVIRLKLLIPQPKFEYEPDDDNNNVLHARLESHKPSIISIHRESLLSRSLIVFRNTLLGGSLPFHGSLSKLQNRLVCNLQGGNFIVMASELIFQGFPKISKWLRATCWRAFHASSLEWLSTSTFVTTSMWLYAIRFIEHVKSAPRSIPSTWYILSTGSLNLSTSWSGLLRKLETSTQFLQMQSKGGNSQDCGTCGLALRTDVM